MVNVIGAMLLIAATQQMDTTTVPARPNARVEIDSYSGDVTVRGWDRNSVRVIARRGRGDRLEVDGSESSVRINVRTDAGRPTALDFDVSVPVGASVNAHGVYLNITMEGTRGEIRAETVQGDIAVRGGSGFVSLRSAQGAITLDGARGRIDVDATNESVRLTNLSGEIAVNSVNRSITMERIESSDVEATSINGDIFYDGTIREKGRYRFATHNGQLRVGIAESVSAAVTVITYQGSFESCFPITVPQLRERRRTSFTLGSGSASVDLESFQGSIRICRPGSAELKPDAESLHKPREKAKPKPKERDGGNHDAESHAAAAP